MEQTLSKIADLESQKYISVETYRRTGEAVRTPVWFVESGGIYFFITRGDSGKVKRLRHSSKIKVAPCRMNGEVIGDWFDAEGSFVESEEVLNVIKTLFNQIYGAVSRITNLFSRMQRKKRVFIKVLPVSA